MDIEKMLKELTIEEKASLCMGTDAWCTKAIERLGLPSIRTGDGPHGLRKQPNADQNNIGINDSIPATCFPPASLTSCSFDRALISKMGEALGEEAGAQGIDVVLGPAVNIKRSPLCGRNFEYVSEDPYLAGEYAVAFIRGVQSKGVGTSLKHYALNNQETLRMNIDAVVDERALREIYLYAFEKAVREAQPFTVMASYNRVGGDYACESPQLLTKLLREEWGFEGLVMSDWSAIDNRVQALAAGCDLEMPYSGKERTQQILAAIKNGKLDEAVLDLAVRNVLRLVQRCTAAQKTVKNESEIYGIHHDLAREIAQKSMVLLKNDGILPLSADKRIALIGEFANARRYQGGGSSHITPTQLTSIEQAFLAQKKLDFTYSRGYDAQSSKVDPKLIAEAVKSAKGADVAVLCIGLTDFDEYEGLDRKSMALPDSHQKLLRAVQVVNENIVVVLCAGSAVEMDFEPLCRGILYAGVMGQAGAQAAADILFAQVNPSGKLSETFPLRLSDTPCFHCFPGGNNSVHYRESIYVGYRYYLSANIPVRYPFGYGLSYTHFAYSKLCADRNCVEEGQTLRVHLTIQNMGERDGEEIAQLYVHNASGNAFTPAAELKDFAKVFLRSDEAQEVAFTLPYAAFARYDAADGFVVDSGLYRIFVGGSSVDLSQVVDVQVNGRGKKQSREGLIGYFAPKDNAFDEAQFARLYGKTPAPLDKGYVIALNTPLRFCTHTLTGKALRFIAKREIAKANSTKEGAAARKALAAQLGDIPIRSLVTMNDGTNLTTGEGLLKMMTGRFFAGVKQALASLKSKED